MLLQYTSIFIQCLKRAHSSHPEPQEGGQSLQQCTVGEREAGRQLETKREKRKERYDRHKRTKQKEKKT